jgi:hypothetical protein
MKVTKALFSLASLLFTLLLLQVPASEAQQQEQLDALEANQQLWNSHGILDYQYYLTSQNSQNYESYLIHVENEQVALVTDFYGDTITAPFFVALTISELFAALVNGTLGLGLGLEQGEALGFDKIDYHEVYGYPLTLGGNYNYNYNYNLGNYNHTRIPFLTPYTVLAQDLQKAMNLWNKRNVTVYSFTLQRITNRWGDYTRPHIIQVDNGTVTSAIDEETGADFIISATQVVDAFFDDIQQALEARRPRLQVDYDEVYGYPTKIFIDKVLAIADEEYLVYLSHLVPVRETPEQEALVTARSLWESQGLERYAFSYENKCRCQDEYRGPWIIQVEDYGHTITSMKTRREGLDPPPQVQLFLPSVHGIFNTIQQGIQINAAQVLVTYNQVRGYPESVYIDYDAAVADEELSAVVEYLAPIADWQAQMDQAKSAWESLAVTSYTYQYAPQTQNLDAANAGPKWITVVDGSFVSVIGVPLDSDTPTIDDLFLRIQAAIHLPAFSVRVAYDEISGYPHDIYIDYDERIGDDEWIATAVYPVEINDGIHSDFDNRTMIPESFSPTTSPSLAPTKDESSSPTTSPSLTPTKEASAPPSASVKPSAAPSLRPLSEEPTSSPVAGLETNSLSTLPSASPTDALFGASVGIQAADSDSGASMTSGSIGCVRVVVWTALVTMLGIPCF